MTEISEIREVWEKGTRGFDISACNLWLFPISILCFICIYFAFRKAPKAHFQNRQSLAIEERFHNLSIIISQMIAGFSCTWTAFLGTCGPMKPPFLDSCFRHIVLLTISGIVATKKLTPNRTSDQGYRIILLALRSSCKSFRYIFLNLKFPVMFSKRKGFRRNPETFSCNNASTNTRQYEVVFSPGSHPQTRFFFKRQLLLYFSLESASKSFIFINFPCLSTALALCALWTSISTAHFFCKTPLTFLDKKEDLSPQCHSAGLVEERSQLRFWISKFPRLYFWSQDRALVAVPRQQPTSVFTKTSMLALLPGEFETVMDLLASELGPFFVAGLYLATKGCFQPEMSWVNRLVHKQASCCQSYN